MRVAVYVRQSLDRTGDGHAVERQEQDALLLAAQRGWTVAETITENDTSASGKRARPGFDRLMTLIEQRQIAAVIAWDLTRLTRNARDTLRLVEAGAAAGVKLVLVRGSDIDLATPAGRLTADVLAAVAHHEIAQKSDRQKRAVWQAAQDGRRIGGRRPFGYEQDGMVIRDHEAAALRQAYDAVLAGVPVGSVANSLNAAGLYTPQRRRNGDVSRWSGTTLRETLLNPRNAGLRALTDRNRRQADQKWKVIGPARWPGIVPEETWRAVWNMLTDPDRRTSPGRLPVGLLTGVARCGVAGCTSTVQRGGVSRHSYPVYRCAGHTAQHITRKCEPIDRYVTDVVIERLSRPDAVELLVDHDHPDVVGLRSRAQALRQTRRSLVRLVDGQTFTEQEVSQRAAEIDRDLAAVEEQMADAGRADVLRPLVEADDVRQAVKDLTTDRLRVVIDTMMTVTLLPAGRGTRTFRAESVVIGSKEAAT